VGGKKKGERGGGAGNDAWERSSAGEGREVSGFGHWGKKVMGVASEKKRTATGEMRNVREEEGKRKFKAKKMVSY